MLTNKSTFSEEDENELLNVLESFWNFNLEMNQLIDFINENNVHINQ